MKKIIIVTLAITGIVAFVWYDTNIRRFQDNTPENHMVSKDKHKNIHPHRVDDNDVLEILAKSKRIPSQEDNKEFKISTKSEKNISSKNDDIKIIHMDSNDFKPKEKKSNKFHCDGRIYCSQMTSCEEAKYFLKNCPNVKMDGNHNGIPCEMQWCNNKAKGEIAKKDNDIRIEYIDSADYQPKDREYNSFHCDGRIYCSQMTSCEEAKYFIRHCPNTKMDGDRDGIPCESQWCN